MKRDDSHLIFIFILYVLIIECIFAEYQQEMKRNYLLWILHIGRLVEQTL